MITFSIGHVRAGGNKRLARRSKRHPTNLSPTATGSAGGPRRPRSGSTPHDPVIADPAPHRSASFWPAIARQYTRSRRSARLPRDRTANPVEHRAIHSFALARTPEFRAKAIRSPASAQLPQHSRRRQISITPAVLSVPHIPRFPALALFGRRLSERGDGLGMPASENLHNGRHGVSVLGCCFSRSIADG